MSENQQADSDNQPEINPESIAASKSRSRNRLEWLIVITLLTLVVGVYVNKDRIRAEIWVRRLISAKTPQQEDIAILKLATCGDSAFQPLNKILTLDSSEGTYLQKKIIPLYVNMSDKKCLKGLINLSFIPNADIKRSVVRELRLHKSDWSTDTLISMTKNNDHGLQRMAICQLGMIENKKATNKLLTLIQNNSKPDVMVEALYSSQYHLDENIIPEIINLLESDITWKGVTEYHLRANWMFSRASMPDSSDMSSMDIQSLNIEIPTSHNVSSLAESILAQLNDGGLPYDDDTLSPQEKMEYWNDWWQNNRDELDRNSESN